MVGKLSRVEKVNALVLLAVNGLEHAGPAAGTYGHLPDGGSVDASPGGHLQVVQLEGFLDPGNRLCQGDGAFKLNNASHADAGHIRLVRNDDLSARLVAAPADPVCEPVVDTADGGINGSVWRVDADVIADQLHQRPLLTVLRRRNPVELAEEERVVCYDDVALVSDRLVGNRLGQIDRQQDVGSVRRGYSGGLLVLHRRINQETRVVP